MEKILLEEYQIQNKLVFYEEYFDNEKEKEIFSNFIKTNSLIKNGVFIENFSIKFTLEAYEHFKFYLYRLDTKNHSFEESIKRAYNYFNFHPLLTIFAPAYENIEKLQKQIEIFEKKNGKITNFKDGFENLCNFYAKKTFKSFFKKQIPKEVRLKNIKKVNKEQKEKLGLDFDIEHRNLILYYRLREKIEMIDSFEFLVIYQILNKYIKGGYSKLFDNIIITSREEYIYPKKVLKQLGEYNYIATKEKDFELLNMGGNFIYLSNSNTKKSEKYHSIPIINNVVFQNKEKKANKYIKANLGYAWDDPGILGQKDIKKISGVEGNIENIMFEIISSVVNLEKLLLLQ